MLGILERDVLTSVTVPFLPGRPEVPFALSHHGFLPQRGPLTKQEADQFDNDIFVLKSDSMLANVAKISSGSGTVTVSSYRSPSERRGSITLPRTSLAHAKSARVPPIEESPRPISMELPREEPPYVSNTSNLFTNSLSTSPSQSSIRSVGSNQSVATARSLLAPGSRRWDSSTSRSSLASKFAPAWLLNPFRSTPSEPQTSAVAAISSVNVTPSATPQVTPKIPPVRLPNFESTTSLPRAANAGWNIPSEENKFYSQRTPYSRHSPMNTPPRDDLMRRQSMTNTNVPSSVYRINPSKPGSSITEEQSTLTGQWHDLYPRSQTKYRFKWQSIVMPACLPLTNDYFPTSAELESSFDVTSYDFVIDPPEMRSFLIKPPMTKGSKDEVRGAWAHYVMRGMVAVRLAQGFQVVVGSFKDEQIFPYPPRSFAFDDSPALKPTGAADVLRSTKAPVYLCMNNEIHRISYTGEAIQVKRFVRRIPVLHPIEYRCLIWPKSGSGCSELQTSFSLPGLTNYGWNRWVFI
jgi:DEP domain-containing protein 5